MRKHSVFIIPVLFLLLTLSACDKTPKSETIATVNGEVITTKEYQDLLATRIGTPVARNNAERQRAIDWLIKRELLIQEAENQDLDSREDVALAIQLNREEVLIRALTSTYLKDNPVTDEDAKKRYAELGKEKEYKISHILLPSEDQAKQFIADIKKGKSFKAMAKKSSLDIDSAKRGGAIKGWVNQYGIVPQIYFAAAKLKNGKISATPVKSDYGWHIVRRDASRYTKLPPYDKYRKTMLERLHRQRIEKFIDYLRGKATIVVSEK
ncbi:MAG: peptidylprolyl isomerase [Acidiferrobacterales bacterium]